MVDESVIFGGSLALLLVGLVVMLYGVSLTAGQSMNGPMIAGGVIVLLGMAGITAPGFSGDGEHGGEEASH